MNCITAADNDYTSDIMAIDCRLEGIMQNLAWIYTDDELKRFRFERKENFTLRITVDVHGMKCVDARRFLNNTINAGQESMHLVIIHGYNSGTAIKDMLSSGFDNPHVLEKYNDPRNPGVTHMTIGYGYGTRLAA